jgi:HK97 gp10 family phage protein
VSVKFTGFDELNRQFNKMLKDVDKDKQEPIMLGASKVFTSVLKTNIPVNEGILKDAVVEKLMPRKEGYPTIAIGAIDRKKAPHAHFPEFGTSKMPARPYFRPTWDNTHKNLLDYITDEQKKIVKGWG